MSCGLKKKKKRKNKEKKSFTEEKRDSRNPITRKSTQKTWLETIFLNPCFSKGVSRLVWQHSHETWIHLVRKKKKKITQPVPIMGIPILAWEMTGESPPTWLSKSLALAINTSKQESLHLHFNSNTFIIKHGQNVNHV